MKRDMSCQFKKEPWHEDEDDDDDKEKTKVPVKVPALMPVPVGKKVAQLSVFEKRGKKAGSNYDVVEAAEAVANVEAVLAKPEMAEILTNPEKVKTAVGVAEWQAEMTPFVSNAKGVQNAVKEGSFKAGAKSVSGVRAPVKVVQQVLQGTAGSAGAKAAFKVSELNKNAAMGLMEQIVVEQFAYGKLAPSSTANWQQKGQSVKSLVQSAAAPLESIPIGTASSASLPKLFSPAVVQASTFLALTFMEFGFGMLAAKTVPSVIKQAEKVVSEYKPAVKPVIETVKEFAGFIGGLLP